jgi:hypothetical protein
MASILHHLQGIRPCIVNAFVVAAHRELEKAGARVAALAKFDQW